MFCKNCGKQVKDDAVFCTHCGTKIMPVGQSQSGVVEAPKMKPVQPVQPIVQEQPAENNNSLMIPIIIVAVCIVAVIGGLFFVLRLNNKIDKELIIEDIIEDKETEQSKDSDSAAEDIGQASISDTEEINSDHQEDIISGEAETEVSQYILPNSDSEYLTRSDLDGLTKEECRLARNELYARHGRKFDDEGLQDYFNSKDWYTGYIAPSDFAESMLNDYEIANRDLIVQYEEEMGYR